jgi:hypothetical protein
VNPLEKVHLPSANLKFLPSFKGSLLGETYNRPFNEILVALTAIKLIFPNQVKKLINILVLLNIFFFCNG